MFNKKYGIIQRITTNDEEISTIHYQIKLQKTALDTIIIDRHPVYINYRRPELMLEQIVDEIGRIFYPLELELYDNAKLKVIANFSDIQKRWKAKKILLENYYKGKVIENLFKKINDRLQYRGQTQRGILDSWFFVLYFFHYTKPLMIKKPKVLYEITLQIEETISETNKFRIYAKGHSIATEMQKDNTIHSTEFTEEKGNLEFVYTLNAQDNSIFSICGKVDLKHHNTIRQINFECYEQY
ncbi:hypothetical protein [Flavobacterium davisii]|uniref:Uncharacterized protein n=1 Tax=Flavobacterium columnare TaxID=996 RepID=A0A8G0KTP1_9FLAO|nr:hypothetical protein [Flavobacterium davisii]QYS89931.1 hypothetical protein JJC05_07220 [Flavobacterium davisii]